MLFNPNMEITLQNKIKTLHLKSARLDNRVNIPSLSHLITGASKNANSKRVCSCAKMHTRKTH